MRVKDFQPKYRLIELILADRNCNIFKMLVTNADNLKAKYGEHNLLSVKNYDESNSTSCIVEYKKSNEEFKTEGVENEKTY